MTAGAAAIVAGVLPLAIALLPRSYAFNPNIEALERGWGTARSAEVYEITTKSIVRALLSNAESLRFKGLFVRIGVTLLVLGLLSATAGVLYAVNHEPASMTRTQPKGL